MEFDNLLFEVSWWHSKDVIDHFLNMSIRKVGEHSAWPVLTNSHLCILIILFIFIIILFIRIVFIFILCFISCPLMEHWIKFFIIITGVISSSSSVSFAWSLLYVVTPPHTRSNYSVS